MRVSLLYTVATVGEAVLTTAPGFVPYYTYTGDLAVAGTAGPMETLGTVQKFEYSLTGVDPECSGGAGPAANSCGIHIHSGMTCIDDAGGHYYTGAVTTDPWTSIAYTSVDGATDGTVTVDTGATEAETAGRALIIHGFDGGRIGCAILSDRSSVIHQSEEERIRWAGGDLSGLHLHITTVHDSAAMNMVDSDGNMLPWQEWRGFQRDVIDWVAKKAGFTFTLYSASGYGPRCPRQEDGSPFDRAHYKGMYNCAGNDVYSVQGNSRHATELDGHAVCAEIANGSNTCDVPPEENTHLFWAMAYITPWRLEAMLFTSPVISDVGIAMVMKPDVPGMWEKSTGIVTPFTNEMWGLTVLTLAIVALVMWITNHGGTVDTKMKLAEELPELYGRYQSRLTSGYLTGSRFCREAPRYLSNGIHTLITGPSAYTTQAAHAGVLNVAVSIFAMVWLLVYGAQLTANLTVTVLTVPVDGIHNLDLGQQAGVTGLACSQGGAAYTNWVKSNFPTLELNENGVALEDMMEEMWQGRCDSLIVIAALTGKVTANCSLGKQVGGPKGVIQNVGAPLKLGPQDMAVGVRHDMRGVKEGLSYWIQQLRGCKSWTKGSPCYNEMNMEELFDKWHKVVNCDAGAGGGGASSIDYDSFLYVFMMCWAGAVLCVLWELGQLRFRDRMITLFFGSGLYECVTHEPFKCLNNTGTVSIDRLRKAFKVSFITACQDGNLHSDSEGYSKVLRSLRRYYVGPDLDTWQLILATTKEIDVEIKVLSGGKGSLVSFASLQRDLALSKHSGDRNRSAAIIGLHWRDRAKHKKARMRMEALLDIQIEHLLAAVSAIEKDSEKAKRDRQAKDLSAQANSARRGSRAALIPDKPATTTVAVGEPVRPTDQGKV